MLRISRLIYIIDVYDFHFSLPLYVFLDCFGRRLQIIGGLIRKPGVFDDAKVYMVYRILMELKELNTVESLFVKPQNKIETRILLTVCKLKNIRNTSKIQLHQR